MGLFGKSNKCPFKAQCPTEEICSHVADSSYQDCNLYEDWSGGGVNENNSCLYKDKCPDYPYSCLFGEYPESCFRHGRFQAEEERSSYSRHDSYSDNEEIDDDFTDKLFSTGRYEKHNEPSSESHPSSTSSKEETEVERLRREKEELEARLKEIEESRTQKESMRETAFKGVMNNFSKIGETLGNSKARNEELLKKGEELTEKMTSKINKWLKF